MTFDCDHQTTYSRDELRTRIVHIGCGAFHRGHQAVYNDICNDLEPEDLWGIAEISLRGSTSIAQDLRDQEMAFCVLETSAHGSDTRLIRTVTGATDIAHEGYGRVEEWFAQPELSIISLTVTEKGYCVHPSTGELNLDHPDITHDLLNPQQPKSAIGLIAKAICTRYDLALTGISVLSCDNMPENGDVLKAAVMGLLLKVNPEVVNWAKSNVSFPSTMVDRIVPAMTEHSHQQLKALVGADDKCGVVGESFKQWVIEDNFVAGRPNWQLAGASLVSDVVPYEEMKLRLLNGSHTFLAIVGSLMGLQSVSQAVVHPELKPALLTLMHTQKRSLNPKLNIDIDSYVSALITRFENPNIEHLLKQIATDSSQKIPVRLIAPMKKLREMNQSIEPQLFLLAAWVTFVERYANEGLADPKSDVLSELVPSLQANESICQRVLVTSGFFELEDPIFSDLLPSIEYWYDQIQERGVSTALNSLSSKSLHTKGMQ